MSATLDLGTLQVGVNVTSDQATKDLLKFQSVVNATEKANEHFKKSFDALSKTIKSIDFDAVTKQVDKFGTTMTTKATLPITALGVACFKLGSDLQETINKVDVTFKENTQTVKDWAESSLESMGMAKQSAMDMAALFGDMGTGMKLESDIALEYSMNLTQLSADMSSFKNVSIERSKTALTGIYTGETEALKSLGIVMTEVNLQEFARSQGLQKSIKDMTQAEKVMLRYQFVMDATKDSQGDFARTSDSAANQVRIFQESLKELGATFGEELLPIVTPMIGELNDLVQAFGDLDDGMKEAIVKGALLVAAIGPVSKALVGLKGAISVISSMSTAFSGAATAIGMSTGALGIFVGAIGVTTVAISNLIAKEKEGQEVLKKTAELQKKIKDGSITNSDIDMSNSDTLVSIAKDYEAIATTIDDLQKKKHELAQAMGDEAIANGASTAAYGLMRNELSLLEGQIATNTKQLKEYNAFLVDNYGTVDAGVQASKTHAQALDAVAKKQKEAKEAQEAYNKAVTEGMELSEESAKFVKDIAEEYMELVTTQDLSAEQLERIAGLEEFLVSVYGDEVIVRDALNRGIGLNISMLDKEITANNNLSEAQRKATNMMAQYGETRVKNQQKTTLNTIKMLEKEIEAYKELQRVTMGTSEWAMSQYALSYKENQLSKLKEEVAGYDFVLDKVGSSSSYAKDYDDFKKNEDKKEQTFEEKQKARIDAYEAELETRKYYNDLTLQEELDGYRELLKIAEGNVDEQERITRELFRVKREMLQEETDEVRRQCDKQIEYRREVLDQELANIDAGLSEELAELQGRLDRLDYEAEQARIETQKKEKQLAIDDAKRRLSMAVTEEERYKASQDLKKAELNMEKFQNDLKIKEEKRRIQEEMRLAREKATQAKSEKQKEYDDDVKAYEIARDLKLEAMETQYEKEFELETSKRTNFNVVETDITKDLKIQYDTRNNMFAQSVNKDIAQLNKLQQEMVSLQALEEKAISGSVNIPKSTQVPSVQQVMDEYRGQVTNINDNSTVNITNYVRDDDDIAKIERIVTNVVSRKIRDYRANKGGGRK